MRNLLQAGAPLNQARGVVILLHGRGGSAEDILTLSSALGDNSHIAYLAPQAPGHTWYPKSFLAPLSENEPQLSNALATVEATVRLAQSSGLSSDAILLCGFSQGACLGSEFVARNPQRYAGLIAFTGGLIGPLGSKLDHAGDLEGTPVLLSSGDPDPHVPWDRVQQTGKVLSDMNGVVELARYPGRPHTILQTELDAAKNLAAKAFPALAAG
jgi:phospholipase/carboxylesterase